MDLFRDKDLKWIKEKGDEAWDWEVIIKGIPGKIAEMGDGPAIGLFTKQLNKWLSPQLSDEIKKELHDVFDFVIEENYMTALLELSDVGEVLIEKEEVPAKLKPWLLAILEIYKGVIGQLIN